MVAFDDNGKIDILGLLPDELEAEILKLGEKKFRAGQIFDWLHVKRVSSFDEMTNLSVHHAQCYPQRPVSGSGAQLMESISQVPAGV